MNEDTLMLTTRCPTRLITMVDAAARLADRSRSAQVRVLLESALASYDVDEHGVIVLKNARLKSEYKSGEHT